MANMFKTTAAKTVAEYLRAVPEERRADMKALDALIRKTLPKLKPFLISGMIGYGKYRYKSKSGREGDWAVLLLANQKQYISLYVCGTSGKGYTAERYKKDFPKASIGKSCIRFKRLADLDRTALVTVLREGSKNPMGLVAKA